MSRRILVVDLHPARLSLSAALAQAYRDGAQAAGHEVRIARLSEMSFDPDFGHAGFRNAPALEPDLEAFREDLLWAEHVVLITPMWWGGLPAKAKGLFDRTLLPGFAFDPRQRRMGLPIPLLSGRTAHFMLTSDTPSWAFWLMYGQALKRQVQRQILSFVGLKPVRHTHYSPVEHSTPRIRARWLEDTRLLGARAA
ncbi:MAG: NAD(P)H-dependent oxidoreductase [Tabrizicola sp.]|uniref:NAD(P)H-dependent oxidoreductase n=1 Tax=Tabrizicola sp. TaxID=2005166 RepID=UPI002ABC9855|nr:NAD(P)H-dependent oxidoreductase [Tabrizicola sp.]MDZ4087192.1 NAD(P)H-dependent oxidoreductase [Tabrizicola sp.]